MSISVAEAFDRIYGTEIWGAQGGGSGHGSSLNYTGRVREFLASQIQNATVFVDMPCGKMLWQHVLLQDLWAGGEQRSPSLQKYLGFDVSAIVVQSPEVQRYVVFPRLILSISSDLVSYISFLFL